MLDFPQRLHSALSALYTNFLWRPSSRHTVPLHLERWAAKGSTDPFLRFEQRSWTAGQFNAMANRHAHAYRALGLEKGDTVALLLDNRPEYLFHFYGLTKLGVVAALVNPQLRGDALVHAINAAAPKVVVSGDLQWPALSEVASRLAGPEGAPPTVLVDAEREPADAARDWGARVGGAAADDPPETGRQRLSDLAAYIYTSGTTGLPKPARVKHHRLWRGGVVFGGVLQLTRADRIYLSLPLCHANGTIISVPMAITHHCQLVLARGFSASRLWRDCAATGATVLIYVGELCRYLHNQPPSPWDRQHQVTRIFGNGMRPDIWERFRERFGVDRVAEFYAATEGNAETVNLFNSPGSCGPLLPGKLALVRYDVAAERFVRDARGLCVPTAPGEPGVLLGAIRGRNEYQGYADREQSRQRIVTDVFRRGDAWFNTGDLLRRDRLRRLFFVDRLGDTFRWKGENVSTQEVAEVIGAAPGIRECAVYGVQVPGTEGRAGMAAVVVDGALDGAALYEHVADRLPDYAQPRFVRQVAALEATLTFKHRKLQLKEEGFDRDRVRDPLWIRDRAAARYAPLTRELAAQVNEGRFPL